MTDFKPSFKPERIDIIKPDAEKKLTIQDFEIKKIKRVGDGDYSQVKKKFGSLAATDAERASVLQKDRKFNLNPLSRNTLSVEQEEQRAIEEKVQARIGEIIEQARSQANESGYKEGFQKGFDEAFRKFQTSGKEDLDHFQQLIQDAEASKIDIFKANERFLIELVFRLARMVILKELAMDRSYVTRLATELLERVGARENISIVIHPQDAEAVEKLGADLQKAMGELKNLKIEVSDKVKRGGCQIETEWNAIDASVETQLQGIYDALVGKGIGSV